ncbi:hypothetical protein SNK04_007355 [Fusarium graminearum]
MASPTPDAPAADSPSRDVTAEKEHKSEVNGHATPDKPTDAPESTTVNGTDNGKTEDHPVENGVSNDVEMADNDEKKASPSPPKEDPVEGENKSDSVDQAKELGDKEPDVSKPAEDKPATASDDVDMADASPSDKPQDDKPAQDESTEPPSRKTSRTLI